MYHDKKCLLFLFFTMFSVPLLFFKTISVSNHLFHNVQCLHSSISRCSVSPLFFFNDNQCIQSSISQCSVSPFIYLMMFSVSTPFFFKTTSVSIPMFSVSIPLFHNVYTQNMSYLYFMNCSVSIPLFHDVQCLHSSISRCSVFPLFFYDNLCFTISSISIPIYDISMSKNSSVG